MYLLLDDTYVLENTISDWNSNYIEEPVWKYTVLENTISDWNGDEAYSCDILETY